MLWRAPEPHSRASPPHLNGRQRSLELAHDAIQESVDPCAGALMMGAVREIRAVVHASRAVVLAILKTGDFSVIARLRAHRWAIACTSSSANFDTS